MKTGKKNVELRLADFKIKAGDILVLKEWNPKKKTYTTLELRNTKNIVKILKIV